MRRSSDFIIQNLASYYLISVLLGTSPHNDAQETFASTCYTLCSVWCVQTQLGNICQYRQVDDDKSATEMLWSDGCCEFSVDKCLGNKRYRILRSIDTRNRCVCGFHLPEVAARFLCHSYIRMLLDILRARISDIPHYFEKFLLCVSIALTLSMKDMKTM